mmetsp:Transcript_45794/g.96093  ORF Transcript_45794/g.96093 Transcript_45794/m.96093 type:complete len:247 (+) Transcript_45794:81-821(+)
MMMMMMMFLVRRLAILIGRQLQGIARALRTGCVPILCIQFRWSMMMKIVIVIRLGRHAVGRLRRLLFVTLVVVVVTHPLLPLDLAVVQQPQCRDHERAGESQREAYGEVVAALRDQLLHRRRRLLRGHCGWLTRRSFRRGADRRRLRGSHRCRPRCRTTSRLLGRFLRRPLRLLQQQQRAGADDGQVLQCQVGHDLFQIGIDIIGKEFVVCGYVIGTATMAFCRPHTRSFSRSSPKRTEIDPPARD